MNVDDDDNGLKYWMQKLAEGMPKPQIEATFKDVAIRENATIKKFDFKDSLDKDDEGKRIIFVLPEAIGDIFCATSLFASIKKQYPGHNLYVAVKPEYFDILDGNPYVHRVINYLPQMENLLWLEGHGKHKGFFEKAFLPHIGTQKIFDYQSNGKGVIALDLKY